MIESYDRLSYAWWDRIGDVMQRVFANDFRRISPHSPQALRLAIGLEPKPTYEQLIEWETQAGEDPGSVRNAREVASPLWSVTKKQFAAYERSIELSPSKDAFVELAATYRASGQDELWKPTLKRFFEVEAAGPGTRAGPSDHRGGPYREGRVGGSRAARAGSGANVVLVGTSYGQHYVGRTGPLGRFRKLAAQCAMSYPTSSGHVWYFWCRRTGRGDVDEARKVVKTFIEAEWINSNFDALLRRFTFRLLENDLDGALADMTRAAELDSQQSTDPSGCALLPIAPGADGCRDEGRRRETGRIERVQTSDGRKMSRRAS